MNPPGRAQTAPGGPCTICGLPTALARATGAQEAVVRLALGLPHAAMLDGYVSAEGWYEEENP